MINKWCQEGNMTLLYFFWGSISKIVLPFVSQYQDPLGPVDFLLQRSQQEPKALLYSGEENIRSDLFETNDLFDTNHSGSNNLNSLEITLMQSWNAVPSQEYLFHKYVFILSLSLSLVPGFLLGHFPVQPQRSQCFFYAIYVYFKVLLLLPLHIKFSNLIFITGLAHES